VRTGHRPFRRAAAEHIENLPARSVLLLLLALPPWSTAVPNQLGGESFTWRGLSSREAALVSICSPSEHHFDAWPVSRVHTARTVRICTCRVHDEHLQITRYAGEHRFDLRGEPEVHFFTGCKT
jgi:hypothetical protein